mgnify:CR=1 FL=1
MSVKQLHCFLLYLGVLWCAVRCAFTGGDSGDDSGNGQLPRKPRYDPCIGGEVEAYFNLPSVSTGGVLQLLLL